uniref:Cyclin-like F-box n=1 Tax=Solanum tuberosum TaxID=4113 RepID=M1D9S5_SOLTU
MERVLKKLRGFAITTIKRSTKSIQNRRGRRQRKKHGREEVLGTTIIEETIPNPDFKVEVGNDIVKENHDLRVHVGDDIVFEILTWLPYKSIMRFKCISKAWNTLAQHDPNFIKLHIVRSHAYFLSHPPLL